MGSGIRAGGRGAIDNPHAQGRTAAACQGEPVDIMIGIFCIPGGDGSGVKLDIIVAVKQVVAIAIVDSYRNFGAQIIQAHHSDVDTGQINSAGLQIAAG